MILADVLTTFDGPSGYFRRSGYVQSGYSASVSTTQADALSGVIAAIARGPDLERIMPAVVEVLTDATACHACFIYFLEGDVLRIRAASHVFAHVVGKVEFGVDEGLCGWVARHRTPAFIRDNALEDPRMKLVPELHEERFQSMVAVPLERGEDVIGVVVLHTEAPREFRKDVLDLLVTVATLVSGAIANARLYDESRRQVIALRALTELSRGLAETTELEALDAVVRAGVPPMLDGARARLQVGGLRTDAPVHDPAAGRLAVAVRGGRETHGVLTAVRPAPFNGEDAQLLEAAAAQLAVAIERAELIDQLRDDTQVRELFDRLDAGTDPGPGTALDGSYAAVVVTPVAGAERTLRAAVPGVLSVTDADGTRLRALVPLPGPQELLLLDAALRRMPGKAVAGRSDVHRGSGAGAQALVEAADAARLGGRLLASGGLQVFSELGPYRFLTGLDLLAGRPDPRHAEAVVRLRQYDAARGTPLRETLERYLAGREGIVRSARALDVHPNTLRQRLQRIEELTGLVLAQEDLLSLELTLKLERLRPPPVRDAPPG